ncbi:hypothetical protein K8P10_002004 [Leucobacter sp. Psy1]|uniref:hypothetical protein n=1 Tax=Leucobacter sp. Psy1 TaxID=2875729 RepID=UPI001CD677FA|nr:hypothetical protein [Leucobacter sp. Psy1]UBH06493.1 hypothetical protein K8P10_002004 [Leucobacter sp. Psy1]
MNTRNIVDDFDLVAALAAELRIARGARDRVRLQLLLTTLAREVDELTIHYPDPHQLPAVVRRNGRLDRGLLSALFAPALSSQVYPET